MAVCGEYQQHLDIMKQSALDLPVVYVDDMLHSASWQARAWITWLRTSIVTQVRTPNSLASNGLTSSFLTGKVHFQVWMDELQSIKRCITQFNISPAWRLCYGPGTMIFSCLLFFMYGSVWVIRHFPHRPSDSQNIEALLRWLMLAMCFGVERCLIVQQLDLCLLDSVSDVDMDNSSHQWFANQADHLSLKRMQ